MAKVKVEYKKLMEVGSSSSVDIPMDEEHIPPTAEATEFTMMQASKAVLLHGPLNLLLFCIPMALISYYSRWPAALTFILSLIALAPLAERLGFVTEQLALHTNDTIGGLLNATFGNATELIVAVSALYRGLYRLVQLSLLGSILSNLLLVLGTALFCGGLKHQAQSFDRISAQINSTLLMLSTMGILFPSILMQSVESSHLSEIGFSRAVSLVLLISYLLFLFFQLKTHKHLYDSPVSSASPIQTSSKPPPSDSSSVTSPEGNEADEGSTIDEHIQLIRDLEGKHGDDVKEGEQATGNIEEVKESLEEIKAAEEEGEDEGEKEEAEMSAYQAAIWLGIVTVFIAFLSDALAGSIEEGAHALHLPRVFVAAIVLPIVGNAAEHAGAVMFAMKNKTDLAVSVAIGSSTQVSLCVLPFLVILSWMSSRDLDLNFGDFESNVVLLSVVSVTFALKDGTSNYMIGLTLMAAYLIVAVAFWAHRDEDLGS